MNIETIFKTVLSIMLEKQIIFVSS